MVRPRRSIVRKRTQDADRGSGDGFRIVRDRSDKSEDVILADVKNNTAVWVTVWALVAASAAAIVHAIL
jgi:hypothetical protein